MSFLGSEFPCLSAFFYISKPSYVVLYIMSRVLNCYVVGGLGESTSPWSARPEPGTWALYPSSSQALNCPLPTSTYFLSNIVLLFLHTIHIEYVCILNYILNMLIFKNIFEGTSLAVQRLRLCFQHRGHGFNPW